MSGAVLRQAAALMRSRAEAADASPWRLAEQTHSQWYGLQSNYFALGNVFDTGNAAHIASWHPAVALAVALLLENEAAAWDAAIERDYIYPAYNDARGELLTAVATAYLGDAAALPPDHAHDTAAEMKAVNEALLRGGGVLP